MELISDGLVWSIESTLNLTGTASVYAALAAGTADMYPEVRRLLTRACMCAFKWGNGGELTGYEVDKPAFQAWLSEEMEEYEAHVRQAGDVRYASATQASCTLLLALHDLLVSRCVRWSRSASSASLAGMGGTAAKPTWSVGMPSLDTAALATRQ